MTGLRIRIATGAEFEVHGAVTWKDFPGDGRVYYCNGQSWPASIVVEVLSAQEKPHTSTPAKVMM